MSNLAMPKLAASLSFVASRCAPRVAVAVLSREVISSRRTASPSRCTPTPSRRTATPSRWMVSSCCRRSFSIRCCSAACSVSATRPAAAPPAPTAPVICPSVLWPGPRGCVTLMANCNSAACVSGFDRNVSHSDVRRFLSSSEGFSLTCTGFGCASAPKPPMPFAICYSIKLDRRSVPPAKARVAAHRRRPTALRAVAQAPVPVWAARLTERSPVPAVAAAPPVSAMQQAP